MQQMARKSPPLTLNYFFGNTSALVESDLLKNRTQRCKLHERARERNAIWKKQRRTCSVARNIKPTRESVCMRLPLCAFPSLMSTREGDISASFCALPNLQPHWWQTLTGRQTRISPTEPNFSLSRRLTSPTHTLYRLQSCVDIFWLPA